MPQIPHLAFPFSFDSSGAARVVEQDSPDEIAGCVAAILSYPIGSRRGIPDFGVETQAFLQGGPDLDEIRSAIDAYEPRAGEALSLDDTRLAEFVAGVRVEVAG